MNGTMLRRKATWLGAVFRRWPLLLLPGLALILAGVGWITAPVHPSREHEVTRRVEAVEWLHSLASRGAVKELQTMLREGLISIDSRGVYGATALHYAVKAGHLSTCVALLNAGAKIDAVTNAGHTALFLAASQNDHAIVKLLCARGADVSVRTELERTPMFMAAWKGGRAVAAVLLTHGASASDIDSEGNSACGIARRRGHASLVTLLEERGACP